MQAAAVSSPWCQAPSPSRTHVTAGTVVPSVSITPTGPTAASYRTAVACTCLKSLEDDTLTRWALRSPHRSWEAVMCVCEHYIQHRRLLISMVFHLSPGPCVQGPGWGNPGECPAGTNRMLYKWISHNIKTSGTWCSSAVVPDLFPLGPPACVQEKTI